MKRFLSDDEKGPFTTQLTHDPLIAVARELQTKGFNLSLMSLLLSLPSLGCLPRRIIETPPSKIHELIPPLDSLRKVMEEELSLVSVFLKVCFKAFLKNPFPESSVKWVDGIHLKIKISFGEDLTTSSKRR